LAAGGARKIQGEPLEKTESAADSKIGPVNAKSAEMWATPATPNRTSRMSSHPKALAQLKPLIVYLFRFSGL